MDFTDDFTNSESHQADPMQVEDVDEQLEQMEIHEEPQIRQPSPSTSPEKSPIRNQNSPGQISQSGSPFISSPHEYDTEAERESKVQLKKRLEEQAKAEEEKTQQLKANARKYLDEFYIKYNEKKEKTFKENRQKEAELIADSLEGSNVWLSVVKMLDLNKDKSDELKGMRELLLELSKGDNSPGNKSPST